jgi:hypothetical protein
MMPAMQSALTDALSLRTHLGSMRPARVRGVTWRATCTADAAMRVTIEKGDVCVWGGGGGGGALVREGLKKRRNLHFCAVRSGATQSGGQIPTRTHRAAAAATNSFPVIVNTGASTVPAPPCCDMVFAAATSTIASLTTDAAAPAPLNVTATGDNPSGVSPSSTISAKTSARASERASARSQTAKSLLTQFGGGRDSAP